MSNTSRSFRLPEELWAAVDAAAAELGQSKTVFVRRALEDRVEHFSGLALGGASVAKTYGVPDPEPAVVELGRGKRPGGFVPRPKKGGGS